MGGYSKNMNMRESCPGMRSSLDKKEVGMKLRYKLVFWFIAFIIAVGFQKYIDNNWIIQKKNISPEISSPTW